MRLPKSVLDNLHFLVAETSTQLNNLLVLLETSSQSAARQTMDRRGYSLNLKMRILDSCFHTVQKSTSKDDVLLFPIRAAETIATELERITSLCHESVRQVGRIKRSEIFVNLSNMKLLEEVIDGIRRTRMGIEEESTLTAVELEKVARQIHKKHDQFFQKESRGLRKEKRPDDLLPALFVAHHIDEMGDSLLTISEALISARMGQKMSMDRFHSLETALEDLGLDETAVELKQVAETRSGSGISCIGNGNQDGYAAILKEGEKKKLQDERQSVKSWHEIYPGLAPQILSYQKRGSSASLLIEHLPGYTFQQILFDCRNNLLSQALQVLTETLTSVWNETRRTQKVHAHHMSQLRHRLGRVQEVHKSFGTSTERICGEPVHSLKTLIDKAEKLEEKILPPFSVYIHGDFNLDNIIFDPSEQRIKFIDLHRSRYSDYVQDVSVFMVSNYRLQTLDTRTRQRITGTIAAFYEFAKKFAHCQGDETFELRLSFGLARSLITSTRFILDKSLAKAMYLRGYYLLERLLKHSKRSATEFQLPIQELF